MNLNVKCHCGIVHKLEVGNSARCQCGATISLRKSTKGNITPWSIYDYPYPKSTGKPEIINKPRGWVAG
jgi:hypothetical protein